MSRHFFDWVYNGEGFGVCLILAMLVVYIVCGMTILIRDCLRK